MVKSADLEIHPESADLKSETGGSASPVRSSSTLIPDDLNIAYQQIRVFDMTEPRARHIPRQILSLLLVAVLTMGGCDGVGDHGGADAGPSSLIIANQGNFGDGNGSVSLYDVETGTAEPGAITMLGTIIQSVLVHTNRLYVMSNTGGRIDVFDEATLERTAQITDVVSPRYMLVDGATGYVTSLYGAEGSFTGGLVTVLALDPASKSVEIPVGDNPEGLALVGSRLYVANHGFGEGTTLSVIDTGSRAVVDTIDVECDGPRFLAADGDDDVFVFCTGKTIYDADFNAIGETDGAVRIIDGTSGEIERRLEIDGRIGTTGPGQDIFYERGGESIFAVKDESAVLVFDTGTHDLVEEIGPFDGQPLSAVAYDERTDRLYLGRSNGFEQAGEVSIHDRSGEELGRFTAGIVPTYIAFGVDDL